MHSPVSQHSPGNLDALVDTKAPLRRQAHANRAMDQVDVLFEWIGDAVDPVLSLLDAAHLDTSEAGRVQGAWATMARAHALDTFSDTAAKDITGPQAVQNGLGTLVELVKRYGVLPRDRNWEMHVPGLTISLSNHAPEDTFSATAVVTWDPFTISDIAKELSSRPASQCLRDTEEVCDLLPSATLPVLVLGTGALLSLVAAGRFPNVQQMEVKDEKDEWTARLVWETPSARLS
jgi:hypothetical protein